MCEDLTVQQVKQHPWTLAKKELYYISTNSYSMDRTGSNFKIKTTMWQCVMRGSRHKSSNRKLSYLNSLPRLSIYYECASARVMGKSKTFSDFSLVNRLWYPDKSEPMILRTFWTVRQSYMLPTMQKKMSLQHRWKWRIECTRDQWVNLKISAEDPQQLLPISWESRVNSPRELGSNCRVHSIVAFWVQSWLL